MENLFDKDYGKENFIVSDKVFENQTPSFLANVTPIAQETLRLLLTLMPVVTSLKVSFLLQLILNGISQAQISGLL